MIIARGKLVATDTMENLTHPAGVEMVNLEVTPRSGSGADPALAQVVQKSLEKVAGVSRVNHKDTHEGRLIFTVEGLTGRQIRPDIARAVVDAGWNLHELHGVGSRLEEIFLRLTSSIEHSDEGAAKEAETEVKAPEAAAEASPEVSEEPAGESK